MNLVFSRSRGRQVFIAYGWSYTVLPLSATYRSGLCWNSIFRVNGVRRSSAKTWNVNPSPKSQFYFNWFGVGYYVREVTSSAKFCSDPMSGWDATLGQQIRVLWLFCFFVLFLYSSTELRPIPVNQFSRTIAQKTRSGVRKTLLGVEKCVSLKFGGVSLYKHH